MSFFFHFLAIFFKNLRISQFFPPLSSVQSHVYSFFPGTFLQTPVEPHGFIRHGLGSLNVIILIFW